MCCRGQLTERDCVKGSDDVYRADGMPRLLWPLRRLFYGRMHRLTETGEKYSIWVGCIYIFNLIVGTGALALPKAFSRAGWLLSSVALTVLAILSFVTVTYIIEAMACANALLKVQRSNNQDDVSSALLQSSQGQNTQSQSSKESQDETSEDNTSGTLEGEDSSSYFSLAERVELGGMANMFFNKHGKFAFYACMCLYLFGDLAIYGVAVPRTLVKVICSRVPTKDEVYEHVCFEASKGVPGAWTRLDVYRLCLLIFVLVVGPFCFFNVQKTKYLQLFTTVVRWTAFGIMIISAIVMLIKDGAAGTSPAMDFDGLPTLFGSSVYAYMCHHSLPGLISPIAGDSALSFHLVMDYGVISVFYLLLSLTGIFAFSKIYSLYTLNFVPAADAGLGYKIVDYYLALFPVFTLSTSFPIIAITLRNNLMNMCLKSNELDNYSFFVRRILFPVVTVGPPIILIYFYQNLTALIKYTGAYAGSGIQYVIPTALVLVARKKSVSVLGATAVNKFKSPFTHRYWAWAMLAWAAFCLVLLSVHLFTDR